MTRNHPRAGGSRRHAGARIHDGRRRWDGPVGERREADALADPDRRTDPDPAADPAGPAGRPACLELRHHAVPLACLVGRLDRLDGGAVPGLRPRAGRGRGRGLGWWRPRQLLGALPAARDRDLAERQLGRHRPVRVDVRRVRRGRREGLAPGRARPLRRADADRPHVPAVRPPLRASSASASTSSGTARTCLGTARR